MSKKKFMALLKRASQPVPKEQDKQLHPMKKVTPDKDQTPKKAK